MTIKRIVNGVEMEFELTDWELVEAYREEQWKCDVSDIEDYFEGFDDGNLMKSYGITREEVSDHIEPIAHLYRKYLDRSDDWIFARDSAIEDSF